MSLVINMITRDAIIVGADSRMTVASWENDSMTAMAYSDSSPKVILGRDYIISHCGEMTAAKGLSVRRWIMDVIDGLDDDRIVAEDLLRFSQDESLRLSKSNAVILVARYVGDSPVVWRIDTAKEQGSRIRHELTSPRACWAGMPDVARPILEKGKYGSMTKLDGIRLTRLALVSSAMAYRYAGEQGIGGPFDIVSLSPRTGIAVHSQSFPKELID